jgi:hypothetical protein
MTQHWHAYSYTGSQRPPDSERVNPSNPTPPLEIAHWLHKPARHVTATFNMSGGRDDAYKWLHEQLREQPRTERDLDADAQMAYAADCLHRRADVVWGYYSGRGRYVSRALVTCPPAGQECPYGK